ncbi:MAG: chitobiase/beta-hexosaminidase C-terminal domain-containing protein [Spirochaetaceae bacterium]|jgi:hypothetical protein|nr:chitobiase/beta-hexosaminidase C-terminal domain-containing protein [Spirochaetaceae bacterium]
MVQKNNAVQGGTANVSRIAAYLGVLTLLSGLVLAGCANPNDGGGGSSSSKVELPVLTPAAGKVGEDTQVTLTTSTPGAVIYYTIDGTDPVVDELYKYSGGFVIDSTLNPPAIGEENTDVIITIKAIAVKTGMENSGVLTASYTIDPNQVATPKTLTATGERVFGGEIVAGSVIILETATEDADIYYTTTGGVPSKTSGTKYHSGSNITIDKSKTIKAIAVKNGFTDSSVLAAAFTIDSTKVAMPQAEPPPGEVAAGSLITFRSPTSGAVIYYTTDGTDPTRESSRYSANSNIRIDTPQTIKAIAIKPGATVSSDIKSEILTVEYTIDDSKVAAPAADPPADAVARGTEITLTSPTSGASIYYTINGSAPTTTPSSTNFLYSEDSKPTISNPLTLKAIAVKSGMTNSSVLTAAYTVVDIAISPRDVTISKGDSQVFTATIDGRHSAAEFIWEVTPSSDYITQTSSTASPGSSTTTARITLNIGRDEPADELTVRVTCAGKRAETLVTLLPAPFVDSVTITPASGLDEVYPGRNHQFTALVEGSTDPIPPQSVRWEIPGVIFDGRTSISNTGVLTVSPEETRDSGIVIKATSTYDPTKFNEFTVTVTDPPPIQIWSASDGRGGNAIAYSRTAETNGLFMAVRNSEAAKSATGIANWSNTPFSNFNATSVCANGDKFYASATKTGRMVIRKFDGSTTTGSWSDIVTITSGTYTSYGIASDGTVVVAALTGGQMVRHTIASGNNIIIQNGTADTTKSQITSANCLVYGDKFVAGGNAGQMAYSPDGTTWTAVSDSKFDSDAIRAIAYGGGKYVAVGSNGKMAYSSDGTTWTAVSDSKFGSTQINAITYGNDIFVAGGNGGKMAYSTDGTTWTPIMNGTFGSTSINGIAYREEDTTENRNKFVAVGAGKMAYCIYP